MDKMLKFYVKVLCYGQGTDRRAILYADRSCFSFFFKNNYKSGPGCSKLTTSLVNVPLNFQELISQICQYFLLKKCEKLLQCKSFSHFFNKKFQCTWS